jgi:hypothetical protein
MTPLIFTMTNAGLALLNRAQLGQAVDLTVAKVALSNVDFVAAPTLTAIPGEVRRLDTVTGAAVGDNVTHMVVRDDGAVGYDVRGIGIILADGTIFAAYAQPQLLVQKSAAASLNLVIDIALTNGVAANLTFGDANFLNPPATTTTKGVVELATDEEADSGTAGALAITARQLKRALDAIGVAFTGFTGSVSDTLASFQRRKIEGGGLVSGGGDLTTDRTLTVTAASSEQLLARARGDVAVTPQSFDGTASLAQNGWVRHPSGLIEQWGVWNGSINNEASFVVPFNFAFPTACAGCHAIVLNPSASNTGNVVPQEVSLAADAATLFAQNEAGVSSNSTGVRWRAWGY